MRDGCSLSYKQITMTPAFLTDVAVRDPLGVAL